MLMDADPEIIDTPNSPANISHIEAQYSDTPQDNIAYRLLGVARFRNAFDNRSPNRNPTGRPWNDVPAKYVDGHPTVQPASHTCHVHLNRVPAITSAAIHIHWITANFIE